MLGGTHDGNYVNVDKLLPEYVHIVARQVRGRYITLNESFVDAIEHYYLFDMYTEGAVKHIYVHHSLKRCEVIDRLIEGYKEQR